MVDANENYSDAVDKARSFRSFVDQHRGGIKPNDHGNPNPLLRILPALYEGNFTVGQALSILFSGSPSDLSEEAVENALSTYLEPTDKAIEAISLVLGFPSDSVQDQIFQHNAVADPSRALEDENPYAEAGPSQQEITGKAGQRVYDKEGNVVGIKYDNVTYSQDESGQWVPEEQPVVDTESEYSVTQSEATIDGLRVRDINYVRDVFEQRGYEATPEEIKNILTDSRINELEGASEGSLEMVLSGEVGTYVNENTVNVKDLNRIFKEELGRRPTDEEVKQILGEGGRRATVQGSEDIVYDFITEATSLPEEPTSVLDLSTDQVKKNWETIKESLGQISSAVGKIIFGPDGMPTDVDEWLDWVDKTLEAQMGPGTAPWEQSPIVLTTAPGKGTWLDLKIPVNFEVNGNPIRIPLFDEDGNFVGSEDIKNAVVNAAGEVLGPLGEIGSILTDGDGNLIADIKDIGNVLLDDLTLGEDGTITGSSTASVLLGDLFFNEDGEWEEVPEVVDINADSTADEDGLGNTTDDDDLGLTDGDSDEEEDDTQPTSKPPAGRLITDQDGNPLYVVGADGNTYGLGEDGSSWEIISDSDADGDGGFSVLEGTTTFEDSDDGTKPAPKPPAGRLITDQDGNIISVAGADGNTYILSEDGSSWEVLSGGLDDGLGNGNGNGNDDDDDDDDDDGVVTVINDDDDGVIIDDDDDDDGNGLDTDDDDDDGNGLDTDEDDEEVVTPIVVPPDGVDGTPGIDGIDGIDGVDGVDGVDGIDGVDGVDGLVGEDGEDGATGATGAAGAAGRNATSGGYRGGFDYQLPQFVGVQYQPKDYTVELDRIINESLFKGMI